MRKTEDWGGEAEGGARQGCAHHTRENRQYRDVDNTFVMGLLVLELSNSLLIVITLFGLLLL